MGGDGETSGSGPADPTLTPTDPTTGAYLCLPNALPPQAPRGPSSVSHRAQGLGRLNRWGLALPPAKP